MSSLTEVSNSISRLTGVQDERTSVAAVLHRRTCITAVGYCMGWTSPVDVKLLNAEESPLKEPITESQTSWIGSLLPIGAIFGPFIAGYLANRIGRKWTIISGAIPLLFGWIPITVATSVGFIYAGRILWGVGAGMLFTTTPMYCVEIATIDSRGALGSYLQVFITIGFLIIYAVGPFVAYNTIAYLGYALIAVFMVGFFFMPETPVYYLTIDDKESAAKSLMILRGKTHDGVMHELALLETANRTSMGKNGSIADIFRTGNFKAFYISCLLILFQQFSGIIAVLFYLNTIFDAAGSSLDPAVSTIIIGVVQAGSSLMTPLVVDRLGRRILLLFSFAGTTLCLLFLGMFFLLNEQHSPAVKVLEFLPILSLVVYIIAYSCGLGPLPWAIMSEIISVEVRTAAVPIATAFCWILSFLTTKYFEPIADAVGMYTAFWIFGVCCAVGFFFTLLVVPETKGKSFSEIQDMLAGNTSSSKLRDLEDEPEGEWVVIQESKVVTSST